MGVKANGRPTEASDELKLPNGKPNGHVIGQPSQAKIKKSSAINRSSSLVARSEKWQFLDIVYELRLTWFEQVTSVVYGFRRCLPVSFITRWTY